MESLAHIGLINLRINLLQAMWYWWSLAVQSAMVHPTSIQHCRCVHRILCSFFYLWQSFYSVIQARKIVSSLVLLAPSSGTEMSQYLVWCSGTSTE